MNIHKHEVRVATNKKLNLMQLKKYKQCVKHIIIQSNLKLHS